MKSVQADKDVDWEKLVKKTKGYSGADIANVCRDAAMMPMRKQLLEGSLNMNNIEQLKNAELDIPITMDDFVEALKNISKSVSVEHLKEYKQWM